MVTDPIIEAAEQAGILALHRLYERISYLITPTASVGPPDTDRPTRLACIAMAIHEYERATHRPLTPSIFDETQ